MDDYKSKRTAAKPLRTFLF